MAEEPKYSKDSFLYPIGNYHGEFSPGNLAFSANLQIFAQQISYLCSLEANGKISPEDAYQEIKKIWKQLKNSKKELLDNDQLSKED